MSARMWITLAAAALAAPVPEHRGCDFSEKKFTDRYNDMVEANRAVELRTVVKLGDKLLDEQPGCLGALLSVTSARLRLADPDAVAYAAAGARLHPDVVHFPILESEARFLAQDFPGALEAARRARLVDPADLAALDSEIAALVRMGRYPESHASLDAASGVAAADLACLRIHVLLDERRFPDAQGLRATCEAAAPSGIRSSVLTNLATELGDEQGALEHGAQISGGVPAQVAASRAMREGRCAEAVPIWDQLVAAEPWNAAHHVNLAAALSCAGERKRAKAELATLLTAEDWITVYEAGGMSGVTTHRVAQDLDEALQSAIGGLVRQLAEDGEVDDARIALRKAEAKYGRTASLATGRIALEKAARGPDAAWEEARAALRSWPADADLLAFVADLGFDAPVGLDAPVLDAFAGHGDARDLRQVAAGLFNARRLPECAAFAQRVLPRLDGQQRTEVRAMGHACAVAGRDLVAADALYGESTADLRPGFLVDHARLLVAAGRKDEAEALARVVLDDAEAGPGAVDLLAELASDAGRLDEAIALAKRADADAVTRFNVSVGLYNSKRFAEARDVARGIECGGFTDADHCRSFLRALAEAP